MTAHPAIAAVPKTGSPNRTLLQALLVSRIAYVIGDDEDPQAFDPRGEDGSPLTLVLGYRGQWFWYDEDDATTGHDGTTCIVTTATGGRYKVTGVDILVTSVISKTLMDPPDPDDVDEEARPSDGDAYIVPTGGTWPSGKEQYIAVWVEARREWFYIAPKAGWFVSIPGDTRDTVYRYDSVQADWITGDGTSPDADTVRLSAIQGCAASLTIRVQNQTTYAPPGARKTGATPTMPLGGTASNINDDSDSTTSTTSALGNLTGAAVGSRIVARLALAATTDLICLEARGVLGSTTSSSNAMGLYYSTDGGASWTQAGSGFTLSTSAQTIQRTGSFAGVTDIALVTEGKNWSSNTHTIAGLNAFDATVTGSVGDAYIVGSPAIGAFAGHENKVAICEVANQYTIYTPATGDQVYDIGLGIPVRWETTAWSSSAGAVVYFEPKSTRGTGSTTTGNTGTYSYSSTPPTTTGPVYREDSVTISRAARRAGASLEFYYQCILETGTSGVGLVLGLFRDSDTNAIDWTVFEAKGQYAQLTAIFIVSAPDALSHTYKIRLMDNNSTQGLPALSSRKFSIKEFA